MMIVLHFLNDFPQAPLASKCRDAVDFVLALHEKSFGVVAGAEVPEPTRRIAKGGSEVWRYFFRLRTQAWQAAGQDPSQIWSRHEAVPLCLDAMKDEVTNEKAVETLEAEDPRHGLMQQRDKQPATERTFVQSQIDALLDGESDWPFGVVLW